MKGGDLRIDNLLLVNSHGETQELREFCSSLTIYEQIDEPFLTGYMSIVDGRDIVKNLRLTGQESVTLKLTTPDDQGEFSISQAIDKTFRIFSITDYKRKNDGGQLTASYVLHFIDPMWFECQRIRVSQVFHGSYSGILYKLLIEHAGFKYVPGCGALASKGEIESWEESVPKNNQFISPNWNINKLIKFCVNKSEAEGNNTWKNSMFYYQTLAGKSRFESFQTMVGRQQPKSFVYTGIADADYSDIDDINKNGVDGPGDTPIGQNIPILSIGVPQRANTMTGHTGGSYASTMITYDPVRKVDETTIYSIDDVFKRGEEGHVSKAPFLTTDENIVLHRLEGPNMFADGEAPSLVQYINYLAPGKSYDDVIVHKVNMTNSFSDESKLVDASDNKTITQQRGQEYRDTNDLERTALLGLLKQNVTRFDIPFRCDLSVGSIGKFYLPTPETDVYNPDELQDENYLVSKIVYQINPQANKGIVKIHGVKDSYGTLIKDFVPLQKPQEEPIDTGES